MAACDDYDKPGSKWDYALLSAALVASLPFIAANAVIIRHRKRSYFQVQGGAVLISISSIAGLIWIIATFVINFHVPRHGFLQVCSLWSFWLQLTFGFWLWFSCQIVRLLHMYRLCHTTSSSPSKGWILVCFLALWIPGLLFTIIATFADASVLSVEKGTVCVNCKLGELWRFCSYLILPSIYFTILVVFLYRSRNIKDHVMGVEYLHTSEYSFIMAFVIYLLYGATILVNSQKRIPGRCFLTFCICFLVFVNFWVRLGRPVYLCLFKNSSEMDKFEEELRSCGAECLDKISSTPGTSQATRRTPSSLQYNDWILRAISAARTEASECKDMINQLQQRKDMLHAKINRLEGSGSLRLLHHQHM